MMRGTSGIVSAICSEVTMQALREVTDWRYNHEYIIDDMKIVAYRKNCEGSWIVFKNPLKGFSRKHRKFKKIALPKEFGG